VRLRQCFGMVLVALVVPATKQYTSSFYY